MLETATALIVLTALFAWMNARFIGLPASIGVMMLALVLSLALVGLGQFGFQELAQYERSFLQEIDFSGLLMRGMLSLLLFAGALHIDARQLLSAKWQIALLAIGGTILSTAIIGFGTWALLRVAGLDLPLPYCLAFGTLISPTDPIAVLSILKTHRVPRNLEITIAGESLFNDGVGVVLFILILDSLAGSTNPGLHEGLLLFAREAGGGLLYGLGLGYLGYRMLRSIDDAHAEILITLGLVLGGYAFAETLHVSGPIAMVMVGLLIGNNGRESAMSERTRGALDVFWAVIDDILNAILFVLIGLEVVTFAFPRGWWLAAGLVIPMTLLARALAVGVPVALAPDWFRLPRGSAQVLTWAGVRGGISVALALSLPAGDARERVVLLTYCVVVFSMLVQGLTIGRAARACLGQSAPEPRAH